MSFQLQAKIIEQPVFSTSVILMSSDYYIFCLNEPRQKVQNNEGSKVWGLFPTLIDYFGKKAKSS